MSGRGNAVPMVQPDRPPYGSYAAIAATYSGLLATAGLIARVLGRSASTHTALDFAILGAANFKAARTISRDRIASFVREPFVEGKAYEGEHERPTGDGMTRAIGELVTCTRCIGTWTAAGLATTQVIAPRFGRMLTLALGTAGVNDFLQTAFVALNHKSDELKKRAGD